jgi:hypothetical protein
MQDSGMKDTLMWEAKAPEGKGAELLDWVIRTALPAVRATPALERAEVFAADDDRVVVIAVGGELPRRFPDPPGRLSERPPHAWPFRRVPT